MIGSRTWYQPFKSQDKTWLRESFWLLAEITDDVPPAYFKMPAWYDQEKKRSCSVTSSPSGNARRDTSPTSSISGRGPIDPKTIIRWGEYGGRDYDL